MRLPWQVWFCGFMGFMDFTLYFYGVLCEGGGEPRLLAWSAFWFAQAALILVLKLWMKKD